MDESMYPDGWTVVDHVIPGVTEEMLDWWWVNMEKGYELWCPDEHKGFRWEVKPPLNGHIGAVQIASESIDHGPVMDLRIEWVDPDLGTPAHKDFWTYTHLLTAGGPAGDPERPPWVVLSHQYEAIPGGCKMRSCMHMPPGAPPVPGWRTHNLAEAGTFKDFLPTLWRLWQVIPDPAINRRSSFLVRKEGGHIGYVDL